MDGIAESDVAVEVSTAGLRKPVNEIYPAAPFLEMCLEAGRPVALSSDAHTPEQLGHEYERAVDWLARARSERDRRLRGSRAASSRSPPCEHDRMSAAPRTGIGYDSHRFADGRPLILGGVEVADAPLGLAGHSDADVLTHAVIDALLGAAAWATSARTSRTPTSAGATPTRSSCCGEVRRLLGEAGWAPLNVDADRGLRGAELGAHRDAMRERLAEAGGLAPAAVSVKFTTNEGMGFVGRGEGIVPRWPRRRRPQRRASPADREYSPPRRMDRDELAFAGVVRQAELLRSGEVSSRELVELYLERIERLDPELNAFRLVMSERALADAQQADARRAAGGDRPLLGVPVAVKDSEDVAGEVTTWGTAADFSDPRAEDNELVRACAPPAP